MTARSRIVGGIAVLVVAAGATLSVAGAFDSGGAGGPIPPSSKDASLSAFSVTCDLRHGRCTYADGTSVTADYTRGCSDLGHNADDTIETYSCVRPAAIAASAATAADTAKRVAASGQTAPPPPDANNQLQISCDLPDRTTCSYSNGYPSPPPGGDPIVGRCTDRGQAVGHTPDRAGGTPVEQYSCRPS